MRVECAWCAREGSHHVIKIVEGPDDQVSHGICERHQEEMLEQIAHLRSSKRDINPRHKRRRR